MYIGNALCTMNYLRFSRIIELIVCRVIDRLCLSLIYLVADKSILLVSISSLQYALESTKPQGEFEARLVVVEP